jgi:nucleotide-binding universal stress UspA family protein
VHVLFALSPGESSLDALETALERAVETGDDLTVAVFGDAADRERLARQATERLAAADLAADVRELDSDPAAHLVELAEREGVDRIALPGGQRSPLGKIQLDSVVEFVLLNATMTVTLIR